MSLCIGMDIDRSDIRVGYPTLPHSYPITQAIHKYTVTHNPWIWLDMNRVGY